MNFFEAQDAGGFGFAPVESEVSSSSPDRLVQVDEEVERVLLLWRETKTPKPLPWLMLPFSWLHKR